ncbi:hypothetical protein PR003_g12840 [Phytophthora rubi]|uniref:Uncharacterized protein n=1 Tax=Phytophthora rubi TaxID=129364 RepID=A0A6A3K7C0_9STRA|nr:hypothetical protein PR002_g17318 [Phytophthora rubi]KAE9335799.1 hypothetical protein PR003_g12840 [Phytophthora rubi]
MFLDQLADFHVELCTGNVTVGGWLLALALVAP